MKTDKKSIIIAIIALIAFVAISMCPPPSELLTVESMRVLGVLVGCVILWAGSVCHEVGVVLLMSGLMAALGKIPVGTLLSAYSGSVLWAVIVSFALGAVMKKVGLLRRIALLLLKVFPKNFVGTSIGVMVVGLVVGPFVSSKNSKGAILGTVVRSVSDAMGYAPKSRQANGLMLAFMTTTMLLPVMVMTGSPTTLNAQGFMSADLQAKYDIVGWAINAAPAVIPAIILTGLFVIIAFGPRKGDTVTGAVDKNFIDQQLKELGPWTRDEKIVIVGTVIMFAYWILKKNFGNVPDYATCLILLGIFWFCGCLDAKTFRNDVPWESVVFIGSCISLGTILPYVGINDWVNEVAGPYVSGIFANPFLTCVVLIIVFFILRFVLLSENGFMSIMCALLYPLAIDSGVNPFVVAIAANMMVTQFFLPYQDSPFLSLFYSFGDDGFDTKVCPFYWGVFTVIAIISMLIGCVIWQANGTWWL